MTPDAITVLRLVLSNPEHARELHPDEARLLVAQLAAVQTALASHLSAVPSSPTPSRSQAPDRLIAPSEAAERLGVTVRWLYRHANQLPFTRRLSRKALRFSEAGLNQYLEGKKR